MLDAEMTGTGEARLARASDGTVLQYEVAGAGEPIVFLLMILRVPTLLLYTEHSLSIEPFIAERLRQVRPDLRQILIAKAGHNMQVDQPEQVARVIRDFLHG